MEAASHSRFVALISENGSNSTFSIGICATGRAKGLVGLLTTIGKESFPAGLALEKVTVVASACSNEIVEAVRQFSSRDPRIRIIEQSERRGKAEAVNAIIRMRTSDFLVFVNADAAPQQGSISELLRKIRDDTEAGVVSGAPVIDSRRGLTHRIVQLMWDAHNLSLLELNHRGISNHSTDELMVVRSGVLEELPEGTVNDGAYIAGVAYSRGYHVRFIPSAHVEIDVPSNPIEVIRQRRRILFGHFQVWKLLGRALKTVEFLLITSPRDGVKLISKTLAQNPGLLIALPFAVVGEIISFLGALFDGIVSSKKHVVWKRYGD